MFPPLAPDSSMQTISPPLRPESQCVFGEGFGTNCLAIHKWYLYETCQHHHTSHVSMNIAVVSTYLTQAVMLII